MNWIGTGFIPIIIYGGFSESHEEATTIITENNLDLLAENGKELQTE